MRSSRGFIALLLLWLATGVFRSAGGDGIDELIEREMAGRRIPGLALSLLEDGHVRKARGYGVRALDEPARVDADTVFEIGSITKQFSAALVMMLEGEDKLRLDDSITRYFTGTPKDWNGITLRHLLTHTSGIPNYTTLEGFEVSRHLTAEQFVHTLAAHPLRFQPGAKFSYCNSGYNLLGFIIEKVSGDKYWDLLQRRIFDPLKMSSSFSRDLPRKGNRASGYEKEGSRLIPRDANLTDVFAAGAIAASVNDLSKWADALEKSSLL